MSDPRLSHNLFKVPDLSSYADAVAAIIFLDDGRYLMQHRDDKPGIFYPDHWGCFGGAMEPGETPEAALRRELAEELGCEAPGFRYFTRMNFGFDVLGVAPAMRDYYEIRLPASATAAMTLGEGQGLRALELAEILLERRVVPYDSFALWLHHAWRQQGAPERAPAQN